MARKIRVQGGGPAGSSTVLSARLRGATVELIEKSKFPRHKVCGEFLSPEIEPVLDRLRLRQDFLNLSPARIDSLSIHIGRRHRTSKLPERGFGLSRHAFDMLLHGAARAASGSLYGPPSVTIQATGRETAGAPARGERLFGFKAHFEGPQTSAVELYFFEGCYVGLNAVEGGRTNVCGLGPERSLKAFEIDKLLSGSPALADRLAPMRRSMEWIFVGPLVFQNKFALEIDGGHWPTGDALSFVDPFTGSGLLSAVVTGELAGKYAAEGASFHDYLAACRKSLGRPYAFSSFLRKIAGTALAEQLIPWVPGSLLFHLTRPAA